MGILSRLRGKKQEEVVVDIPKKEVALYVLLEMTKGGILDYLQGNGILVKAIDTNIDIILKKIIRETGDSRLIIIDYGIGLFSSRDVMSDLIEIAETSSSDGKNVTIFTNNGSISKELRNKEINATVVSYKGASDIVKELAKYNEIYNVGGAAELQILNQIDFKGASVEKLNTNERAVLKIMDLNIIKEDGESEGGIQGFNVRY